MPLGAKCLGPDGPSAGRAGIGCLVDVEHHKSVGDCAISARALRSLLDADRRFRATPQPELSRREMRRVARALCSVDGPTAVAPADGPFIEIPLNSGVALISPEDASRVAGKRWSLSNGYAVTAVKRGGRWTTVSMHRLIMDAPDGSEVDHRSGDRLDNRRGNLRLATRAENSRNSGSRQGSTSKFKGVSWNPRTCTWDAYINVAGTGRFLGSFGDEELAARIYDAAARDHFGEFARLNLPGRMLP